MKNFQTIMFPVKTLTWSAGGYDIVELQRIPTKVGDRLVHVVALHMRAVVTPTYTTAPTIVGHNALVAGLEIFDGSQTRFNSSFNALRFHERFENGGIAIPEALTNGGTGNPRYFTRSFYFGPPHWEGSPTDWAFPAAALENGELRVRYGALTDISADTTANTATLYVYAECILFDQLRIPPLFERQLYTAPGSDYQILGRGLYCNLFLGNSTSYDAFAAGDVGTVQVLTGQYDAVPNALAQVLTDGYNRMWARGDIGGLTGDPANATYDVAQRVVNGGTPTALQAQALDQQPVLYCGPGHRISKTVAIVENALRVKWSGANGSGTIVGVGRILPQSPSVVNAIVQRSAKRLGVRGLSMKIDTTSGRDYKGPFVEYMPWVGKLQA